MSTTKKKTIKQSKRFREAGKNLLEIQKKIAPFVVKRRKVVVISTAGRWSIPSRFDKEGVKQLLPLEKFIQELKRVSRPD